MSELDRVWYLFHGNILRYLSNEDVRHCAGVSKEWRATACDDGLWKERLLRAMAFEYSGDMEQLYASMAQFDHVIHQEQFDLGYEGIEASSTDGDQSIEDTLIPMPVFWSSLPNPDQNSDEHLTYRLCEPCCIVSHIQIKAMANYALYAPREVTIDFSMDGEHWFYTEGPLLYPMGQVMIHDLSRSVLCSYVRIRLIGKRSTHFVADLESMYYACIERVRCMGHATSNLLSLKCNELAHLMLHVAMDAYKVDTFGWGFLHAFRSFRERDQQPHSLKQVLGILCDTREQPTAGMMPPLLENPSAMVGFPGMITLTDEEQLGILRFLQGLLHDGEVEQNMEEFDD